VLGAEVAVVSLVEFYDGLASDYHLLYGDCWDAAVVRQGGAVDRLIRAARVQRRQMAR